MKKRKNTLTLEQIQANKDRFWERQVYEHMHNDGEYPETSDEKAVTDSMDEGS